MLRMGIHVPQRDASWELEENAFSELLEVHQRCDVEKCLCDSGREYFETRSKWHIVRCFCCGSRGTHLICSALKNSRCKWTCAECFFILTQKNEEKDLLEKKHIVTVMSCPGSIIGKGTKEKVAQDQADDENRNTTPDDGSGPSTLRITRSSTMCTQQNTNTTKLGGCSQVHTRRRRTTKLGFAKRKTSVLTKKSGE
ncbi:hypothetical protein FKM82_026506 [Ascaphus truei]